MANITKSKIMKTNIHYIKHLTFNILIKLLYLKNNYLYFNFYR